MEGGNINYISFVGLPQHIQYEGQPPPPPPPSPPKSKCKLLCREFSQNLLHHLWDREAGYSRSICVGGRLPLPLQTASEREIHKSITPNLTIQNVDKPLGYMRKFTPDGSMLLSFSHDQRSLEVYAFGGVGRAASLLQKQKAECITAADHSRESLRIRQQIYEKLFTLRWRVQLTPTSTVPIPDPSYSARYHLNREFSIFLANGRYVLLASVGTCAGGGDFSNFDVQLMSDIFEDCDLYAFVFFLVDLQQKDVNSCVSDMVSYRQDCIALSHNHGVSVHGQTIAIMSKYRQCIDLYNLVLPEGKMKLMYTIGPFGGFHNEMLFLEVTEFQIAQNTMELDGEISLPHLKQKILTFLYKQILEVDSERSRKQKLKDFYKNFRLYERMIMNKIQLIAPDHLLIRYEGRPLQRLHQQNVMESDFKLYVFYDLTNQKVLRVYQKNSIELLYLLRNFCDNFRNVRSLQTRRPSSSPSNNTYFRAAFNGAINSIPGGQIEAALRFNPTLPISTQSFATTQYLDYDLFNYDDRLISALERPKISSQEPIRFSDRNTNITKFRLFLEAPSGGVFPSAVGSNLGLPTNRELVAFIFHPYEPFIISIQKLSTRYVVNFHIYNEATVVKQ